MQGTVVDKTAEGRQTELEGALSPVGIVWEALHIYRIIA